MHLDAADMLSERLWIASLGRVRTRRLHIRHRDAVTSTNTCRRKLPKTLNHARNGPQRATEASRRGNKNALHVGDTLQNVI